MFGTWTDIHYAIRNWKPKQVCRYADPSYTSITTSLYGQISLNVFISMAKLWNKILIHSCFIQLIFKYLPISDTFHFDEIISSLAIVPIWYNDLFVDDTNSAKIGLDHQAVIVSQCSKEREFIQNLGRCVISTPRVYQVWSEIEYYPQNNKIIPKLPHILPWVGTMHKGCTLVDHILYIQ